MFSDGEVRLFSPHSAIDLDHPFLKLLSDVPLTSLFFCQTKSPRVSKRFQKVGDPQLAKADKKHQHNVFQQLQKQLDTRKSFTTAERRDALTMLCSFLAEPSCAFHSVGVRESDAAAPPRAVAAVPEGENTPKVPIHSKIKA